MNNNMPFFNPYNVFDINNLVRLNPNDLEKISNKIERLEKNLRILEKRVNNLEKNTNNKDYIDDEPTDMYII